MAAFLKSRIFAGIVWETLLPLGQSCRTISKRKLSNYFKRRGGLEDLSFFLDDAQYTSNQWWRIKDLFKQFYALRQAAECFQYGRHCTSDNRNPAEINKEMAAQINKHIETVIIPEIRKALDKD